MKIICSWCGKTIKEDDHTIKSSRSVSHGICSICSKEILKNLHKRDD